MQNEEITITDFKWKYSIEIEKYKTVQESNWSLPSNARLLYTNIEISHYEKDNLIGYIDCVSNGVTDAYIQDLMVHPEYQGKGVGTELMNQMIAYLKEKRIYMISVVYEESLKPFYEKFGFYQMLCGQMETFRS